ncbi:MAG: response regulator FixJ [Caulobacteraceae bacterium]|nr:response regulator FixJ [Caulobacteraceae bacterium]
MRAELLVHVIDDDDAVRDSLAFLLDTADFLVRTYESADAFLAKLPTLDPGCIITDVRMPGLSGLDLVRRLNEMGVGMPVIVITGHGDVPLAVEAMKGGVIDFIEKPFDDDVILKALKTAFEVGEHRNHRDEERAAVAARLGMLSARERQVLNGVVAGQPNKVVAHELGISPRTVEVYRANLMTKMQAASLSELVRMVLTAEA